MSKVRRVLGVFAFCACIWSCMQMDAKASEGVSKNTILIAESDIEVKESADDSSQTLQVLQKGAYVYVEQEVDDTWCMVTYQDISGYVKCDQLKAADIDTEALAEEMADIEQEGEIVIEEVERVRTEKTSSIAWIIAIALVLWGIIMTGILCSTLKKSRRRKKNRRRKKRG